MKAGYMLVMAMALSVSATAFAEDGEALFKKSGCMACHAMEKKSVGPSVKDIAAKYKGDHEAQAKLEAKVRAGGSGSFGGMPMPAVSEKKVSNEGVKVIVEWALSH